MREEVKGEISIIACSTFNRHSQIARADMCWLGQVAYDDAVVEIPLLLLLLLLFLLLLLYYYYDDDVYYYYYYYYYILLFAFLSSFSVVCLV